MNSNEETNDQSRTRSLNRRTLLKAAGTTSIAVIEANTVSAAEAETRTHFIEKGWRFDPDFPDDFRKESSIAHIDKPLHHTVDADNNRLHVAPKAPDTVKQKLRNHNKVMFGKGYNDLPSVARADGTQPFENGIVPLSLSGDTRRTSGMKYLGRLDMTQPTFSINGTTLDVKTGIEKISVGAGANDTIEMPEQTLTIEERIPAKDPRNSNETRAPLFKEREIPATPKLVVRNHGKVNVVFDSNGGVQT